MQLKAFLVAAAAIMAAPLTAHADTIDPAQAIAQKFSEATEEKPPSLPPRPPRRSFAKPGADYEVEMLQRARIEELERQLREAQAIAAKPTEPPPSPPASVLPVKADPAPMAKLAALPAKLADESTIPPPEAPKPVASAAAVLLVIDPKGEGGGFKPDPIICIDNRCWLSNGITSPAREMARNEAVALQATDSLTTDSCSGKSGCVYRNVELDPDARIDVIEVGEGGGASIGAYTIAADKSCRKDGDSLACSNGLVTQNFRIWVVPEATAADAGTASLENAVAEGLPDANVTSSAYDK